MRRKLLSDSAAAGVHQNQQSISRTFRSVDLSQLVYNWHVSRIPVEKDRSTTSFSCMCVLHTYRTSTAGMTVRSYWRWQCTVPRRLWIKRLARQASVWMSSRSYCLRWHDVLPSVQRRGWGNGVCICGGVSMYSNCVVSHPLRMNYEGSVAECLSMFVRHGHFP